MKSFLLLLTYASFIFGEAFFLIADNHEPILFCIKVCPLYCASRRFERDASHIYVDDDPYFPYPDIEEPPAYPYNICHYINCKTSPKPTSPKPTSPKPTSPRTTSPRPTSTMVPSTWICEVCQKKCGYPSK